jgi:hypothetical protein
MMRTVSADSAACATPISFGEQLISMRAAPQPLFSATSRVLALNVARSRT